jgi:hypothetical protein
MSAAGCMITAPTCWSRHRVSRVTAIEPRYMNGAVLIEYEGRPAARAGQRRVVNCLGFSERAATIG